MSLVFWDQYVDLDDIYRNIGDVVSSADERNELVQVVDELIHHRLMTCVLENLENEHHEEFLAMFTQAPHSDSITEFLKSRIKSDFVTLIGLEVDKIRNEIKVFLHLQ